MIIYYNIIMLRNYYYTLDMPRTYLKGYCHLIYFFFILLKIIYIKITHNFFLIKQKSINTNNLKSYLHHINIINKTVFINIIKLFGLFASALLHIFDFNNFFIEKTIFFFDYFFAILNCHISIHYRCSTNIRYIIFNSVCLLLSILTLSFIILINIDFLLFRNIYHIGFIFHLIFCYYKLYISKFSNKIDLLCFNKILIPIMSILLIKILPFDFYNNYFDTHDLFQLLLVLYDIHINDQYILDH